MTSHFTLWGCLCLKDDSTSKTKLFQFTAPVDARVFYLQKFVCETFKNALRTVHPDDLKLWKLKKPIPYVPKRGVAEFIRTSGDAFADYADKLDEPGKIVSEIFQNPAADLLHIIVQAPASATIGPSNSIDSNLSAPRKHALGDTGSDKRGGKRSHSEQQTRDLGVDEGWLDEFYQHFWGQPQRESEIFFTAHLTLDHYIKLQERLDAQFPDRRSDSYDAQADVTAIKLEILRSALVPGAYPTDHPSMITNSMTVDAEGQRDVTTTTNSSMVSTADIEGQGEDDIIGDDLYPELTEISRFLPATVKYLDLSTIPFSSLPIRCPFPLLIRKEYDIMADLLNKGLPGQTGSFMLTGQPGIGKTSFLYLVLIIRLLNAQPTFFQTMRGSVYYMSARGVLKIPNPDGNVKVKSIQDNDDVVALVDADGQDGIVWPRNVLLSHGIRIMLVSSPRRDSDRKWLKQLNVPDILWTRTMDIWSEEELIIAGTFLHRFDMTYARLSRSISYFGHSPRQIFAVSRLNDGIEMRKNVIKDKIIAIPSGTSLRTLLSNTHLPNDTSPTLFEISCTDPERQSTNIAYHPTSKWVLNELLSTLSA